jgi:hypothetical protein
MQGLNMGYDAPFLVVQNSQHHLPSQMRANKDVNSGNSIGIGICPQPTDLSRRVTSASPILRLPPRNLTVKTDSKVTKILFKNLKAMAVQLSDGTKCEHKEPA